MRLSPPAWPRRHIAVGRRDRSIDRHHHLQLGAARRDLAGVLPARCPGRACPTRCRCRVMRWCVTTARSRSTKGRSQLSFTDVAALIDPTTVTFTSLTDPATRVLEQNFQFDLVSTQKLLLKFIDKQITVDKNVGNTVTPITGTLLSAIDGIVLRGNDGSIYSLPGVHVGAFPGSAGRPQHAAHAGVGHPVAGGRHAEDARHLPDRRHHLVGGLQPHLQRRRGCQQRPARSVGLGEHHQPVGRHVSTTRSSSSSPAT